jgi:hypothetical protein
VVEESDDSVGVRTGRKILALQRAFLDDPTIDRVKALASGIDAATGTTSTLGQIEGVVTKLGELRDLFTAIESAEHRESLAVLEYAVEELAIGAENDAHSQLALVRAEHRSRKRLDHLQRKIELARNKHEFIARQTGLAAAQRALGSEPSRPIWTPSDADRVHRVISSSALTGLDIQARVAERFLARQTKRRIKQAFSQHYPWILTSVFGLVVLPGVLFARVEPWLLGTVLLPVLVWALQEAFVNKILEDWRFRGHCRRLREDIEDVGKARIQCLLTVGLSTFILGKQA